jgi:predicted transcriptional regulator
MAGLDRLIQEAEGDLNTLKEAKLSLQGRKRAGRKKGAPKARKRETRRGRKTRAVEALQMIEEKPGIGATEIAKTMKIKSNYLYRVLGKLEDEGKIKKSGPRSYEPVPTA